MKNKLLLTAFMTALFAAVNAQFTIRVAGGYAGAGIQNSQGVLGPGIDPGTPTVDALAYMANVNDSLHTYKAVHGSYGAGGNVTIALGYMFNKFIGIDVGFSYAHSNDISCTQYISFSPQPLPGYINATINSNSYAFALAPSVVITGEKMGWKVYPYSRIGISLPVAGALTDNVSISSPYFLNDNNFGWLGNHTEVTMVTKATVSVGVNAAVGVAYRALPFMNVFAEVNFQHLNVRAKSSTITKWTASGDSSGVYVVDNDLSARGAYRTQFNYVDQLTSSSNNAQYNANYNLNEPKQDTRPVVPGSSLGFNIGVTFFLSKKTLKKNTDKNKPAN